MDFGYRPWWAGGDPWPTDEELESLIEFSNRLNKERQKGAKKTGGGRGGRRGRRGGRRRR